jgi:hypothetical protein
VPRRVGGRQHVGWGGYTCSLCFLLLRGTHIGCRACGPNVAAAVTHVHAPEFLADPLFCTGGASGVSYSRASVVCHCGYARSTQGQHVVGAAGGLHSPALGSGE